jgi:hypothetical protein
MAEHDRLCTVDPARLLTVVNERSRLIYHGPKNNTIMTEILGMAFSSWCNRQVVNVKGQEEKTLKKAEQMDP